MLACWHVGIICQPIMLIILLAYLTGLSITTHAWCIAGKGQLASTNVTV